MLQCPSFARCLRSLARRGQGRAGVALVPFVGLRSEAAFGHRSSPRQVASASSATHGGQASLIYLYSFQVLPVRA